MDFELIAKFRKDSTKEHVSGKILLAFAASLLLNSELTNLMKEVPKKPAYIRKITFDIFAQTLSIRYDENVISTELLERIFNEPDDRIVAKSLELLHTQMHAA